MVLKFGTEIDFLYLRTEFLTGWNRFIITEDIWNQNFFEIVWLRFLREYFIYQFQILITYYTHRRLFLDESSSDYLYLFSRKKYFWKKVHSFSPTITGVKANPWSWNLAHKSIFYMFEPCSLPEIIGLLWPKVLEIKNFSKYFWIAFCQRIFYLPTLNFNHLLHSSMTLFG